MESFETGDRVTVNLRSPKTQIDNYPNGYLKKTEIDKCANRLLLIDCVTYFNKKKNS